MFPFCVVSEVVSIVPQKKTGLNFAKGPNPLYSSRIGSDVIIPFVLFGDSSLCRSAMDACVKLNKKFTRSDSIQRSFYCPLLRICVPAVFSSALAIDPFLRPGIATRSSKASAASSFC